MKNIIKPLFLAGFMIFFLNYTGYAVEKNSPSVTPNEASNQKITTVNLPDKTKTETKKLSFREKFKLVKQMRKEMKKSRKGGSDVPMVVLFILAIFLPPVAVGIYTNWGEPTLWNLLFTLLFWFPGIIHAFYILLR